MRRRSVDPIRFQPVRGCTYAQVSHSCVISGAFACPLLDLKVFIVDVVGTLIDLEGGMLSCPRSAMPEASRTDEDFLVPRSGRARACAHSFLFILMSITVLRRRTAGCGGSQARLLMPRARRDLLADLCRNPGEKGSASRFGRPIRYRTREHTAYDRSIPMS